MGRAIPDTSTRAATVLTGALVRASRALGLTQKDLAAMLGVSEATVSRLTRGRTVDPATKEGELARLFVRLYRSLDAMVGGNEAQASTWLHSKNNHLNGTPNELIRTVGGLVHVVEYLDALRGKS
jgi:transcriptional regulator with XRE-family HTH domain